MGECIQRPPPVQSGAGHGWYLMACSLPHTPQVGWLSWHIAVGWPNLQQLPHCELGPKGGYLSSPHLLLQMNRYWYPNDWRVCWPAMESTTELVPLPDVWRLASAASHRGSGRAEGCRGRVVELTVLPHSSSSTSVIPPQSGGHQRTEEWETSRPTAEQGRQRAFPPSGP